MKYRMLMSALVVMVWGCGEAERPESSAAVARFSSAPVMTSKSMSSAWPQFRGPQRNGLAGPNQGLHNLSQRGLRVAWKRPIGIGGYSSVVSAADRAFTLYSDGKYDFAVAVEVESGEELWKTQVGPTFVGRSGSDTGPLSTPTYADGRLFVLGPHGHFMALDAEKGKMLWQVDIREAYGSVQPFFGFSTSPLVINGMVILQTGGGEANTLVAFSQNNGEEIWRTFLDDVDYGSPTYAVLDGVPHLVLRTKRFVAGLNPADGAEYWRHPMGGDPFATPMALDPSTLFVMGWDESLALRVRRTATGAEVQLHWESKRVKKNFSEPVIHDTYLFGYNNERLTCISLLDGSLRWQSREPGDGALALVDDQILVLTSQGRLVVVTPSSEGFTEQYSFQALRGKCVASPSIANGRIFARSLTEMVCLVPVQ